MDRLKAPEQTVASTFDPIQDPRAEQLPDSVVSVTPTQVRRPWRSTARSTFQALVALAVLFPVLVQNAGLDTDSLPWLVIPLGVAAALTRIMALPQVEEFLRQFLPFLAAAPKPSNASGRRIARNEAGVSDTLAAVIVVAAVVVLMIIFFAPHR